MARSEKFHLEPGKLRLRVIELSVTGPPAIDAVARSLGTTSRTLQRHLALAGMSYRAIVAAARQEAAERLLSGSDAPVHEIAARLGYASPGGFSRAFARCARQSPRAWRREARRSRE